MTLTAGGSPLFLGPVRRRLLDDYRAEWTIRASVVVRDGEFRHERRADIAVTATFCTFSWFALRVRRQLRVTLDPVTTAAWHQFALLLLDHAVDEPTRDDLVSGNEPIAIESCQSDGSGFDIVLVRPHVGYGADRDRQFAVRLPRTARWSFQRARRAIFKQTHRIVWLAERTNREWAQILQKAEGLP